MSLFSRVPLLRWFVPLVTAAVLLGGGWALTQISAAAGTDLKPQKAAQLLVDVQQAHLAGLSGEIVQKSDLGLPSVPGSGGSGSSNLSSLVSGSHTLRVWFSGPDKARVQLLGTLGESDVVLNGTDLWTWSSKTHTATHRTVQPQKKQSNDTLPHGMATPQSAAKAALAAINPTTKVTTAGTTTVAGRPAYQLLLRPRDNSSLVGEVRIAIDGATHVPTQVQVVSRSGTTAFQVGFTSFHPGRPGKGEFRFNPPPHTKVIQQNQTMPDASGMPKGLPGSAPQVIGHGWSSVVVADLGQKAISGLEQKAGAGAGQLGANAGQLSQVLNALPAKHGPWGSGHAFQGTIFSAVVTNDGRVAIGPVPLHQVYDALAKAGTGK